MPFVKFDSVDSTIRGNNQRVSNWAFSVSSYILVLRLEIVKYIYLRKRLAQKPSVYLPHFSAKYLNCPFEVSSWLCMRKTKTVTKIRKESAVASFLNAIQCKHRGDYRYQTIKEKKIRQCMTESIICFVFLSLHQLLLSLE